MMKRVNRPHFIPRAYLRNFSENDVDVFVYDKKLKTTKCQSISNTGLHKNLYSSEKSPDFFDQEIVVSLEGRYKTILEKLKTGAHPAPKEFGELLNFIVLQFLRTPSGKKRQLKMGKLYIDGLRKEYKRRLAERINSDSIKAIILDYLKSINREKEFEDFILEEEILPFSDDEILGSISSTGLTIMNILGKQPWQVLVANKEHPWITSDDPLCVFDEEERRYQEVPLLNKSIKVIPLSKEICVVIGKKDQNEGIPRKIMTNDAIDTINLAIAENADRFIYSSSLSILDPIVRAL